jgi:hypothetical protein
VSDREAPLITGVNGTLMARPDGADLYRVRACFSPVPSIAAIAAETIVQRGDVAPAWKATDRDDPSCRNPGQELVYQVS